MPRISRVVVPGYPHHVIQRGNRRQDIFFSEDDYRTYLRVLKDRCSDHGVRVWAYCLMPNHAHLIVVPPSQTALCRAVGEAHRRYTRHINLREDWRGHLFQGRFASFVLDESYLIAAARFIELDPVRAKLAATPDAWQFSSAAAHVTGRDDSVAEGGWLRERTAGWVCTWSDYLQDGGTYVSDAKAPLAELLRRHESTGRPLGDEPFIQRISGLLGRNLMPRGVGRPRNRDENSMLSPIAGSYVGANSMASPISSPISEDVLL